MLSALQYNEILNISTRELYYTVVLQEYRKRHVGNGDIIVESTVGRRPLYPRHPKKCTSARNHSVSKDGMGSKPRKLSADGEF